MVPGHTRQATNMLSFFDSFRKYPRTLHLPFSRSRTNDDKTLTSVEHFLNKEVVVTVKMDGENTSLYRQGYHARSMDSRHHPSRDWLKAFHATFAHDIPQGWRICGENLYARHSLAYEELPSYFMGFSVWTDENVALAWDDTLEFFELLGIVPVATLYRSTFNEALLKKLAHELDTSQHEGFVVRLAGSIAYEDFAKSAAKWVRPKHVQTDEHWMHAAVVPNGLKGVSS